jgi:hypothetical protein
MSKATEEELRSNVCSENRCWVKRRLKDANVTADLRGPWQILRLDSHFSACVKSSGRIGGLCDGVAVLPQESSNALRVIELKPDLRDLPKAKAQLQKGAELISGKLENGFSGLRVSLELHVGKAPRNTMKPLLAVKVGEKKLPLRAFKDGAAL